jgi:hypothetical protein
LFWVVYIYSISNFVKYRFINNNTFILFIDVNIIDIKNLDN